jgi:hypothetical protein
MCFSFSRNFNLKLGMSHIQVNLAVSWHFLIRITANPTSTSYKPITGEKAIQVWKNVELLPSIVSITELLEELSKNIHSKDITHKHNITVRSQTSHNNYSKRQQQRFNTHFVHTMSLSVTLFTT